MAEIVEIRSRVPSPSLLPSPSSRTSIEFELGYPSEGYKLLRTRRSGMRFITLQHLVRASNSPAKLVLVLLAATYDLR
jgi:hypothetical protein